MKNPKPRMVKESQLEGIYYDSGNGRWLIPSDVRPGWVQCDSASAKRFLRSRGIDPRGYKDALSPLDEAIVWIQTHRHIDFAGPLAGYRIGVHVTGGKRLLVTSEAEYIQPRPGRHPVIDGLVDGLLGVNQRPYFIGWLSCAVKSLTSGVYVPGQAITLAGSRGCGKTLLLDVVIRSLLGERATSPIQAWTKATPFNADLAGCELLSIDDEAALPSTAARRELAAQIKNNLFVGVVRIHPKGGQPFTARPFWRAVFCVNSEPEHLSVLPALDDSLLDKVSLFSCARATLPFWPSTPEQRGCLKKLITDELPAFMATLISHEVETELRDDRCGVRAYQHPDLLRALSNIGDEGELLALIDRAMGSRLPTTSPITAREVQEALDQCDETRLKATHLLRYSNSCGILLGRLAASGHRVRAAGLTDGVRRYYIDAMEDDQT